MEPTYGRVSVGVDIGQKVDPTAIVVAEATKTAPPVRSLAPARSAAAWGVDVLGPLPPPQPAKASETRYVARDVGRLPLGTSYPDVARRLADVVRALRERTKLPPRIVVDATGVGAPVIDVLREALAGVPYSLLEVTFTHGDRYTKDARGQRTASLGKAYLVSRLQALLQTDRLDLPKTPETAVLARELRDYEIRVDEDANDKYGAFKVGTHDDLVTALGLAVLDDPIKEGERKRLLTYG